MRKMLLLCALLITAATTRAVTVNVDQARSAAGQLLLGNGALKARTADLKLLHTEVSAQDGVTPLYYIFTTHDGFVVVAGDDRARTILAYGDSPIEDLRSLPSSMLYWLKGYRQQMEFLIERPTLQVNAFALKASTRTVNPMITANWSQNAPYWNECPVYGTDTCYTGCAATSLAQVFNYWKYPRHQTPAVPSYELYTYGTVLPELPPTTFDWANMLDEYTGGYNETQATAVAHLMRYIGQAEEMNYTISGSGALAQDVLRAVQLFEYDQDAQLLYKSDALGYSNYSDEQWSAMMVAELEAGHPIVYCAYENTTGEGHAFNVDGYDSTTGNFHVNWGWSGRGNGFFALNAFSYGDYTFGTAQQMVIGIQPPADAQTPRLQAYPVKVDLSCYINQSATATFALKGTNLTAGVTLTLNDPDGVFALDAATLSRDEAEAGKDITVTYSPSVVGSSTATIVCESEGTGAVTITLNGTAPLEIYPPVMLPADENRVTLTSFRADWTDETPAGNVASYTLEVNPKPAYTLIAEADFSELPKMTPTNQASHAGDYLPEGWTFSGSEFNLEGGCVSMRRNGTITTSELDLKGYDKMTVEVTAKAYGYYGDGSELYVTTSQGTQELIFMYAYETKTIVVDCNETERIVFKAGYYPMIKDIKIYAGDATQAATLAASETGDANYRLITGITAKNYTVNGLTSGGTFLYKVKAVYNDGTESDWSNVEMVTLADIGHVFQPGDVNHDGSVTISDVTALIDMLLGNGTGCEICADVNGDDSVSIGDVTALIDRLLAGN